MRGGGSPATSYIYKDRLYVFLTSIAECVEFVRVGTLMACAGLPEAHSCDQAQKPTARPRPRMGPLEDTNNLCMLLLCLAGRQVVSRKRARDFHVHPYLKRECHICRPKSQRLAQAQARPHEEKTRRRGRGMCIKGSRKITIKSGALAVVDRSNKPTDDDDD